MEERVKWELTDAIFLWWGIKHCGKGQKEKMLVTSIFSFSNNVSRNFFSRGLQVMMVYKGLKKSKAVCLWFGRSRIMWAIWNKTDHYLPSHLRVPFLAGAVVIVKNYTGDRINFGLSMERAKSEGISCEMIVAGEDCALASHDKTAGRRGLCGVSFLHKVSFMVQNIVLVLQEWLWWKHYNSVECPFPWCCKTFDRLLKRGPLRWPRV